MTYKLNPFTGKLDTSDGPQGPAGVVSAAGPGSQATPSISFAADLDTGLYNYTPNGIAVSTGGTGRLFIDSSGRVGIGTTSPNEKLDVRGKLLLNNGSASYFDSASSTGLVITNPTAVRWEVNSSERLRITADGKLGVGTSSPQTKLHVQDSIAGGSGGTVATLQNFSDTGADNRYVGLNFRIGSDNGTSAIRAYRTNSANNYETNLSFWTNPAGATQDPVRAMTIDSYQRVGIGIQSPQSLLHIAGGGSGRFGALRFSDAGGTNYWEIGRDNGVNGSFTIAKNGTEYVCIDYLAGNVGIGATSVDQLLHLLKNQNGGTGIIVENQWGTSGANSSLTLKTADVAGSSTATFAINKYKNGTVSLVNNETNSAANLAFTVGTDERARIDNSGRLLVGTSNFRQLGTTGYLPQILLEGTGGGASTIGAIRNSDNANGPSLTLGKSRSTAVGGSNIVQDDDVLADLNFHGADGTALIQAARISAQVDGDPDPNNDGQAENGMPGRLVFSTTAVGAASPTPRMTIKNNGRVGIGTQTPGELLHVSGGNQNIRLSGSYAASQSNKIEINNGQTGATRYAVGLELSSSASGGYTSAVYNSAGSDTRYAFISAGPTTTSFLTSNTERARIDSSGRLLVGTDTTSSNNRLIVQSNTDSATGPATLLLAKGDNAPGSGSSLGLLRFGGSTHTHSAEIYAIRDGGTWTAGSSLPTAVAFSTTADGGSSPTERMRISNGGDLIFNGGQTAGQVNKLSIVGAAATGGYFIHNTSATSKIHAYYQYNGTTIGSISTTTTNTAYNTSSDYRLKENVVPLTGAADRLNKLQVRRFNFIADPDKTVDGFLAHEAQAVVPECVTGTKDEVDEEGNPVYQGIDQSKLVPLLTAALQEALAKIETLEQRLSDAGIA